MQMLHPTKDSSSPRHHQRQSWTPPAVTQGQALGTSEPVKSRRASRNQPAWEAHPAVLFPSWLQDL